MIIFTIFLCLSILSRQKIFESLLFCNMMWIHGSQLAITVSLKLIARVKTFYGDYEEVWIKTDYYP